MRTETALRTASSAARRRGGTTGIVRQIDELGRIVIPIEIRKRFGLREKDPLEISVHEDLIVLSKPRESCVFCGRGDGLREHRGRAVCPSCITELARR